MNISNCEGFQLMGAFIDAMKNFRSFSGEATYIIASSCSIPRLEGRSNILYIGQTESLGGENGRLWNYNYAQNGTNDWRIKQYSQEMCKRGSSVFLYICTTPPAGKTIKGYESFLLEQYREEHWELPPWNSQA